MEVGPCLELFTGSLHIFVWFNWLTVKLGSEAAVLGCAAVNGLAAWILSQLLYKPTEMHRAPSFQYCLYHGPYRRR